MSFFSNFPKTTYDLYKDGNLIEIQDIFRMVDVNEKLIPPASAYSLYYILDGERPDMVANRLYSNPNLAWTFFVMNDKLKDGIGAWPLSYNELQTKIEKDYGRYAVFELEPTSFRKVGMYANPFEELSVRVLISGSHVSAYDSSTLKGTIHRIDPQRNTIWIELGEENASLITSVLNNRNTSEEINGYTIKHTISITDEPIGGTDASSSLYCTNGWSSAALAPFYYEGNDGVALSIYDALSSGMTSNPYLYREMLEEQNDELRSIRVVKQEYITEFAELFKEYVNS